ncbi:class I SAM-dependent methyltransferase [Bradyrhizobium sp. JYMT SZCCT0180]|uniref:class I SAM-dependent methyltransferase n=1 Tax=Bradyrhizobium sp. JYMT SZCCT0180 TaxID=2807666 RepID=UPI001BAC625B|nr:class I SAM-dependent methyltransferase [Bradyrhizobium sp. JYMT SZCCT0180]MBR1214335.1 class I SAM-dependent methyltransferase [Bradyrhizobium sp. JYMT SZCCT0180]
MHRILSSISARLARPEPAPTAAASAAAMSSAEYWSQYKVDSPSSIFDSVDASLRHYAWRNAQYPGYIELMPVDKADGLTVLDFGCGPGNDIVGFGHFSKTKKLFGADVSPLALGFARRRAALHNIGAEFVQLNEARIGLPLADSSVDLIHSSGVVHHTPDPVGILRELKRVLRPDGHMQIMVYHRDSIWMHLYVAYVRMIVEGEGAAFDRATAFRRSTDGPDCPISNCYTVAEFIALTAQAGLRCEFAGASMSLLEMKLLSRRFEAIESKVFDPESRDFLSSLTFDNRQWPYHNNAVAGINACFRLYHA